MLHLYEIADGKVKPKKGDPSVVICIDELGPLNLLPRPGKAMGPDGEHQGGWVQRQRTKAPASPGPPTTRKKGVRHLMAAYDLNQGKIYVKHPK